MADVTIYVTNFCPYCVRAKGLLDRKKVPYTLIDVSHDHDKREWLVGATGRRTVPQIYIGEVHVGGYDDLVALDRAGGLEPLLASS